MKAHLLVFARLLYNEFLILVKCDKASYRVATLLPVLCEPNKIV